MLALIYLALAIYLGDLLCRRFYRFVSTAHRWAAAILVGIFLSTWFTCLAGLAFAHTAEPLLLANLLFFVVAAGAIFWLSRKAPNLEMLPPRAARSSTWDWITLGTLVAAVCVLLIGTLYVNKQGHIRLLSGMQTSDFASQLAIAQSVALGRNFSTEFVHYANWRTQYQFLFYFQAGNLEFLGLNLAWSVDVLSVLGLMSMLALVMALGELLFNSHVVGRLGATFFFFHGSLRHLTDFLPSRTHGNETLAFWKQVTFVNQRHLLFAVGILLLVIIFLVDQYRQSNLATAARSDATTSRPALTHAKSFVFSGLLLAALPIWSAPVLIAATVALFCLLLAYVVWWLSRVNTAAVLARAVASTLTACILAAGVMDLLAVYSSSRIEVKYEREPLVKGLVFRNLLVYKLPEFLPAIPEAEDLSKAPVTAFQGGHGAGRGQFDNPRGIAIDSTGNIFVADTGNGRIEKFSRSGTFLSTIGSKGRGHGQLSEPNGIAIDQAGNIFVADAGTHRVLKLKADGTLIAEWNGPDPGFYGPRRIAVGPDNAIYVVDQGRTRIVKLTSDGQLLATWGSSGNGDGQFDDPTSVAVDPITNKVYVADPRNSRIQVFDSNGRFLTKWRITEWGRPYGFEDLAIDPQRGRVYTSSANINTVLVFNLQGDRIGSLTPTPPDKLDSPAALALAKDELFVINGPSARVSVIHVPIR